MCDGCFSRGGSIVTWRPGGVGKRWKNKEINSSRDPHDSRHISSTVKSVWLPQTIGDPPLNLDTPLAVLSPN